MISVVIPTRNRLESLNSVLKSLSDQTLLPNEIIIVDSSDKKITLDSLYKTNQNVSIKLLHSLPSVCNQRNEGIRSSCNPFVFLCDDDMIFTKEYLFNLNQHLEKNDSLQMVSGLILEKNDKEDWDYQYPLSKLKLIYNWFFGLSIITDISKIKTTNFLMQFVLKKIVSKGNGVSKSGWPIFVQWQNEVIEFPFFSLMATMIRKPTSDIFDPIFVHNGIGDNYDACLKIGFKIHLLKNTIAYHHKSPLNRINRNKASFYRTAALHYILLKHDRFNRTNRFFLVGSLLGILIPNLIKMNIEMSVYNLKLIKGIITGKNMYGTVSSSKNN